MVGAEHADGRDASPVLWRLHGPPIREALQIAQAAHTAILSLAGRHFGTDAIPSVLSGRAMDGSPLRGAAQHGHKHLLCGSADGERITHLAVWAPSGLTGEEREVILGVHLRHRRRHLPLAVTRSHPAFAMAAKWRTSVPYLPFNHVKVRGPNSVEGQVRRELVAFRGLPSPQSVSCDARSADGFALHRRDDDRRRPTPFQIELTFGTPIVGPIALGRHAHFSLGVLVPVP